MPSQDFTNYTADIKEKNGNKEYNVHIVVTNAAGACNVTKTNVENPEDVIELVSDIDGMGLREDLLIAP